MIKNEIVRIVEKIQEICAIQKTNNPIHINSENINIRRNLRY